MFSKKVYYPNSVDVMRNDGTVQRGLAVDKQESGVLVDFGIDGKDPELTPYRHVFLDDEPTTSQNKKPCDSDRIQVLLKRDYDQPWTWYPCRFLEGSLRTFAVVEARIGEDRVVEFVCSNRIRYCPSSRRRLQRTEEPDQEICLGDVPLDVMEIIFSFFDARTQVILRPVCRVWDAAALSPQCSKSVVLNVGYVFRQGGNCEYLLAGLLYHCVKKSTKSLVILNRKLERMPARTASFVREKMLENRCISVCILILAREEAGSTVDTISLVNKMSFFETTERLLDTMDMVFEQMLESPDYTDLFAKLCTSFFVIETEKDEARFCRFRRHLVFRMQETFESMFDEKDVTELDGSDSNASNSGILEEKRALAKCRSLSIVRFISNLYKMDMFPGSIVLSCMQDLLPLADTVNEDKMEYLCEMLQKCAPDLEQQDVVNNLFGRLENLISVDGLSPRLRSIMQKTVDFKNRNYIDL